MKLTHWGWDKMAAILQTIYLNAFFLNENIWISIKISLKFIPKGLINNIPSLVQIMAWRRGGNKPFSEAMMVRFLTYICITRHQWVNSYQAELMLENMKIHFHFFFISQHQDGIGISLWRTRTCVSYRDNTMAADALATQGQHLITMTLWQFPYSKAFVYFLSIFVYGSYFWFIRIHIR